MWQPFRHIQGVSRTTFVPRRRYSVTSDILSYRRCAHQYGFEVEHGYEPSRTSQLFYGTIVHQVLDRAHAHFAGLLDPATRETLPTDEDIERYFSQVQASLRARGIRGARVAVETQALRLIQIFNRVEGPTLYPRVVDTEHRMQSDETDFILHGTVDVLTAPNDTDRGFDSLDIWDYKGVKRPRPDDPCLQDFEFQMLVYASLYFRRHGVFPRVANLYFLNELIDEQSPINERRQRALLPVTIDQARVQVAVDAFKETVGIIEDARLHQNWPAPVVGHGPGEDTCVACDRRWNCTTVRNDPNLATRMPIRYP
ncbi:MAG: PD-(D/E)XK nuclease family protein [Chloroflexi bacterium]|nr:PD-(D/E)XK nuclease family protein [Chloroflexota bacterium]